MDPLNECRHYNESIKACTILEQTYCKTEDCEFYRPVIGKGRYYEAEEECVQQEPQNS